MVKWEMVPFVDINKLNSILYESFENAIKDIYSRSEFILGYES